VSAWRMDAHLQDHYGQHRAEFPGASIEEYDASAQETLTVGVYFELFDDRTEQWRTGSYHRATRRLIILDEDDQIVSHFHCSEWYVESLTDSTYG